jgi:hypothetical protein
LLLRFVLAQEGEIVNVSDAVIVIFAIKDVSVIDDLIDGKFYEHQSAKNWDSLPKKNRRNVTNGFIIFNVVDINFGNRRNRESSGRMRNLQAPDKYNNIY